jgi:glyoxylase-like metal-dependent hydrolase (beta-lactamase superfamily II)
MGPAPLRIISILSMPFAENSYVLFREGGRDALVVDPGLEPEPILEALQKRNVSLAAILNTHGHADHIAGNEAMKDAFPAAPLIIGEGDAEMLADPELNLSRPFGFDIVSPPADRLVKEGDILEIAGIHIRVRELPGHSPGHVVFILESEQPIQVLGGDTLFEGSIGRTDFPGGNHDLLLQGIRTKLYTLPDDTLIYPGHGEPTSVEREKRTNPFVRDH